MVGLPTDNGVVPPRICRPGGQPGRRQSRTPARSSSAAPPPWPFHAHLQRQRVAWPYAQSPRSHGDTRLSGGARLGRDRHALTLTATTSAARCVSPPIATARSACAPASPASSFNPTAAEEVAWSAVDGGRPRTPDRAMRDWRSAMARGDRRDWRWNDVPMQARRPRGRSRWRSRRSFAADTSRKPRPRRRQALCKAQVMSSKRSGARPRTRRRDLAPDHRHRILLRFVAANAEDGRPRRHRRHARVVGDKEAGRSADLYCRPHRARRPAVPLDELPPAMAAGHFRHPCRPAAQAGERHDRARPGGDLRFDGPDPDRTPARSARSRRAVGSHGRLRTGVQIMAARNRICLDAGESSRQPKCRSRSTRRKPSRAPAGRPWRS